MTGGRDIPGGGRTRAAGGRGLTLIELVVSTAAVAVLMGGMASAVLLATRALPESGSELDGVVEAGAAVQQLAGELLCAVSVGEHSAVALEFAVPDRNNDGLPETIRYHWSGTPGDPLHRRCNGGGDVPVVESVESLRLSYAVATFTRLGDPAENESAETLLASHSTLTSLADAKVKADRWWGQYFKPTLPAGALRWKVTRVLLFVAKEGAASGTARVQIRPAGADGRPRPDVLAELTLAESSLTDAYQWREFAYGVPPTFGPDEGACVVVQHVFDADACKLRYRSSGVTTPTQGLLETTTAGAAWNIYADKALLYYVYGTVTTLGEPQEETYTQLYGVRISLRTGGERATRIETLAPVLNAPEMGP